VPQKQFNFQSAFAKNSKFHWDFHKNVKEIERWEIVENIYERWNNAKTIDSPIIPKLIHQIWLGSPVPSKYDAWRASWKKFHPEYEYKLWTESEILKFGLVNQEAYLESKNFAVKSDIARCEILFRLGGIYADTDFECLTRFDQKLMSVSCFLGQTFTEKPEFNNALMGCIHRNRLMDLMVNSLAEPVLHNNAIEIIKQTGAIKLTNLFFENELYLNENILILPSDYFYPWPNFILHDEKNRYSNLTKKSIAIHHWEMSWFKLLYITRIKSFLKKMLELINRV
jgi:mannosyltransferase OCH1-like enzyme